MGSVQENSVVAWHFGLAHVNSTSLAITYHTEEQAKFLGEPIVIRERIPNARDFLVHHHTTAFRFRGGADWYQARRRLASKPG
jgi:hypothetical protein